MTTRRDPSPYAGEGAPDPEERALQNPSFGVMEKPDLNVLNVTLRVDGHEQTVTPLDREADGYDNAQHGDLPGVRVTPNLMDPIEAELADAERARLAGPRRRFGRFDTFPPAHWDGSAHTGTPSVTVEAERAAMDAFYAQKTWGPYPL